MGDYMGGIIEFRSAIVDECGTIVWYCDEVIGGDKAIQEFLDTHPEWSIKYIEQ